MGRRRRALARDKAVSLAYKGREAASAVRNRALTFPSLESGCSRAGTRSQAE